MTTAGGALLDANALLDAAGVGVGMVVADLGCGVTGHTTIPAAMRVGSEGMVYAVDVQQSALAATESKAKLAGVGNVQLLWADLERPGVTAIPEASLDVALLVSTLHMTKDPAAVLQEAARLTKPGGRVLVVDWKPIASPLGPPVSQRLTPDAIRRHARTATLTEQRMFAAGKYHYGLVFTRLNAHL